MEMEDARQLDGSDPLAFARDRFHLPENVIYLDGNSLGALPKAAPDALTRTADAQWGEDLIASWNKHGCGSRPSSRRSSARSRTSC